MHRTCLCCRRVALRPQLGLSLSTAVKQGTRNQLSIGRTFRSINGLLSWKQKSLHGSLHSAQIVSRFVLCQLQWQFRELNLLSWSRYSNVVGWIVCHVVKVTIRSHVSRFRLWFWLVQSLPLALNPTSNTVRPQRTTDTGRLLSHHNLHRAACSTKDLSKSSALLGVRQKKREVAYSWF